MPTPLVITQVQNGYVVERAVGPNIAPIDHRHVFQTFSELIRYLGEHFDYRVSHVEADKEQ